jgi:hypothetical protein
VYRGRIIRIFQYWLGRRKAVEGVGHGANQLGDAFT